MQQPSDHGPSVIPAKANSLIHPLFSRLRICISISFFVLFESFVVKSLAQFRTLLDPIRHPRSSILDPPSSILGLRCGCGSAVLVRYFSSYSFSASRRGSSPSPGVSARVTQLSFGAGGVLLIAFPAFSL